MARRRCSRAKLRRRFPKVLAEVCGHRIRTLHQLILELLGPSLRLAPCNCKGPGEEHLKYCASCDPSTYLLRDDDHADYWTLLECSYGMVSNTAPRVESFALENRWSQLQIIERATELQFRKATRPLNVICFGYRQPEPNKTKMGSTSAPYGLECASSNSVTSLLNSQAWMILLSRVGDMFMFHLLLYTSVFYPLPNNSYLQVTGVPVSSLVSSHQPHEPVQSGHSGITHFCSVNSAATEMCRTSGFQTDSEWSNVKDECQLKACSHCVEMDRTIPLIGFGLNLSKSRNKTGNNGYERVCGGDTKRPHISDHWTSGYKNMKTDSARRSFRPKRLLDSHAVCRSGDYCQDGCSPGTTALNYQHIGHIIAEMNAFYRPPRGHSERGSVHLPGSYSHLSNKFQCNFLSSLKSDMAYDPVLHPGWEGEDNVMLNCSTLENISSKALQSSSYNVAKNGGQPKKRCRPFRWQRCERYKARKRVCKVKDGTPKDSSSSQQLQSLSDFDNLLVNDGKLKQPGATFQCVSRKDSLEKLKVARKFSDKILVSDQMFPLESDLLSLNGKEDNGLKVDVLRHVKCNRLSSSKYKHMSQAGTEKVDNALKSIPQNQTQGPRKSQCCSKFTINRTHPVSFEKNANHKQESSLVCNRRKLSCRCLCWLMSHTNHMDEVNALINRRSLFYNSRRLHCAGFPKNHILNVIKPNNTGAKQLFALIFGLHDTCLCNTCSCHEDHIGGAKVFESLSKFSPLLSLLKVLIRNAQHCGFVRLLERHSPIQIEHQSEVFSTPSSKAFHTRIKREELLALITEHVKRNILRIGPHFYIQKVGIPQGSVLSSLLCSFYFGHLDRNRILPLLGHNQKKHIIGSLEKTFTKCRLNGDLSSSKVLIQACGGGVGTCFFEEKDKISGISTRHSQKMKITKETLDRGLTACSRHCQSVSPKSILLRLIDDSLFISTSKKEAFSFIAAMHKGFKDYNCYTNEQKTSLNFDMELEGKNLAKNIYETEDGSCFMQWSGLLINCHTLEIQADYTRYCGTHISSTITVLRQKNQGYHLVVKLCQFMRPKCHPIFYDSNINSPTTVRLNAYQAFLLCAMKFHVYVCSMPSVGACSPTYAFQAIMKTTRYMYKLVKQRMHSIGLKTSSRPIFLLQQKEMEWLGFSAYHKVLWRKQSRHRPLLSFLETKLHSPEYQDLVSSLDLQFAIEDCRSSMFWQIQY